MQYNAGHNRILAILALITAFVVAAFPISDPDIFQSLRAGQLIASGQFPWGKDPFGYASGTDAPWIHPGWLGDLVVYGLFESGGGPLLVLTRSLLVLALTWLLLSLGSPGPRRFLTVLAASLGLLALCPRLYMRTELFSYLFLAITLWTLAKPAGGRWFAPLHRMTADRWYWLLPPLFALWANLDGWFFLGPITVLAWLVGLFLHQKSPSTGRERKSLSVVFLASLAATLCSPFHFNSYLEIPNRLFPATGTELVSHFEAQKKQTPATVTGEQTLWFVSPWSGAFFNNARVDTLALLAPQSPFLPLCYPSGLSISEWSYYALVLLALASLLAAGAAHNPGRIMVLILFLVLGAWQSRFVGFFAVCGAAMAALNWQLRPRKPAVLKRARIWAAQAARLGTALALQLICLLMLIPSPDAGPSVPAPYGHVHPRGALGFSFRVDPTSRGVAEQLLAWRSSGQLTGNAFHVNWWDIAPADAWFNPGGRVFLDKRYEVHDPDTAKVFFDAQEALIRTGLIRSAPDGRNQAQIKARQQAWQKVFREHDISHLVIRRRDLQETTQAGTFSIDLIIALLNDRDDANQPVWRALRYHDGMMFVLGWTGSPHWPVLEKLAFDPGQEVFRTLRSPTTASSALSSSTGLGQFLSGDPPRRPSAIDESRWHSSFWDWDSSSRVIAQRVFTEFRGFFLLQLGAQAATPVPQVYVPLLLSDRQGSASPYFLALEAARRAVQQLAPNASARQRADAWDQLVQAIARLKEYELRFTLAAGQFRDPLTLYALRRAAFHCEAANRLHTHTYFLQLAKVYLSNGAFDTALDCYRRASSFLERNAQEYVTRLNIQSTDEFLKQIPSICQKELGRSPADLENLVKQQVHSWEQTITQQGWRDGSPAAHNRARAALLAGLADQAVLELASVTSITDEIALLAIAVHSKLGQFDLILDEYLTRIPSLKDAMKSQDYHQLAFLGRWCKGQPLLAADHQRILGDLLNRDSLRSLLGGSNKMLLGTTTQPVGTVMEGSFQVLEAETLNLQVCDHRIVEGILRLEGGNPQAAAELFFSATRDIAPVNAWKPLIARYYHQITGRLLDHDLAQRQAP